MQTDLWFGLEEIERVLFEVYSHACSTFNPDFATPVVILWPFLNLAMQIRLSCILFGMSLNIHVYCTMMYIYAVRNLSLVPAAANAQC